MIALAQLAGTLIVGLVGLYLVHSHRRQTRVRLAEARRSAYSQLWEATGLAAPTRLDGHGTAGLLTPDERRRLYQRLTSWYYREGNGMLLESTTRQLYLNAKYNLTCETAQLRPSGLMDLLPETNDAGPETGVPGHPATVVVAHADEDRPGDLRQAVC
jgi:hypothetical protein